MLYTGERVNRSVARGEIKRRQNTVIWCRHFPRFRSGGGGLAGGGGGLAVLREGVIRSRSQPITARGLGSAVSPPPPPAGSGAEPQPPTILEHFRLKRKHLVLYKSIFSKNSLMIQK